MKIILTGATGFIGGHLLRHFVLQGHEVHVILRKDPDGKLPAGLQFSRHIMNGTTQDIINIMNDVRPDMVIHVAAYFTASHKTDDVENLINSNILFTTQIAEAMRQAGVKKMIYTTTAWEHAMPEFQISLYAATKAAGRNILSYFSNIFDLQIITLTLFDTYGPNDRRGKILSLWKDYSENGKTLQMSPGEQKIDLVHIGDVVTAYEAAANILMSANNNLFVEYGVASGAPISLRDLAEIYSKVMSLKPLIAWGALPYRDNEIMTPWEDYVSVPGWKANISLQDGLLTLKAENEGHV